jgi:dihydroorotase-like cyclic amidohydrolase
VSLIIRGPVFTGQAVVDASVRIDNGTIVEVAAGELGTADRVIELAPGQTLLPAALDTLCAMRDWAEAPRDTVETVSRAALASGVTVICDQSNTIPRLDTPELVRQRSEFVAAHSYVDFGIQPHPPVDPQRIVEYREAGAFAVSVWQWDLRPWNYPRDIDDSRATFRRYAELGLRGLVFPDELTLRETSLEDVSETYALQALLRRLDPQWECRVFVTLADSVELLLQAKEQLPKLLIQIAPHYLFMTRDEAYERIGSGAVHSPPLRTAANIERLQEYAAAGKLDIFVSQHTPHRTVDKFSSAPVPGEFTPKRGYSSIDYSYPLYLTRLGFAQACRGCCENPARHLGLKKGVIARGYEADLAIVEECAPEQARNVHATGSLMSSRCQIDPASFHSLGKVTPFVGERLKYRVVKTFLRGEEVYDAASGTFTRRAIRQVR